MQPNYSLKQTAEGWLRYHHTHRSGGCLAQALGFTMARKQVPDQKKRLVGTWRCCDHFSDVVVKISVKAGKFNVVVLDKYDGEKPEVYDVAWSEKQLELSFAAHWSSGRFVRYRFMPSLVVGRLELTFSYTDQELWERA